MLFLFWLCLFAQKLGTQEPPGDVLDTTIDRDTLANIYLELARKALFENDKDFLVQAQKALNYGKKIRQYDVVSKAMLLLADYNFRNKPMAIVLKHDWETLKMAQRSKNSLLIGRAYHNLSTTYYQLNQPTVSLKYKNQAKSHYAIAKDNYWLAMLELDLGVLYHYMQKYQQAEKVFRKVLDVSKKERLAQQTAQAHYYLGATPSLDATEREHHYRMAIQLFKNLGNIRQEGACRAFLSILLTTQNQYRAALTEGRQALTLSKMVQDNTQECNSALSLSDIFLKQGRLDSALYYARLVVNSTRKSGIDAALAGGLQGLAAVYDAMRNYRGASEARKELIELDKKIYEAEQRQAFENEQLNLMVSEKERALELSVVKQVAAEKEKRTKVIIWGLVASSVALVFFIFLLSYRNRLLKQEKKLLIQSEEVRKTTETLRSFNYTVGHDLKAPILHLKHLLQELTPHLDKGQNSTSRSITQSMEANIKDAQFMLEGMLQYAQYDQSELLESNFQTQQVVEQLIRSLKERYPEQEVEIQFITPLPDLQGDPLMLRQVFYNLLSNAIKFSKGKKPALVTISSTKNSGAINIQIKDNGIGIAKDINKERIFQLFKTAHNRGQFEGSGVGLAIVKKIMERHGGNISVESAGIDQGSSFNLIFPLS